MTNKLRAFALVVALVVLAGAAGGCGKTEKAAGEGDAAGAAGPARKGPNNAAALFAERCESCHGPNGTGGSASALNTPEVKEKYRDKEKLKRRIHEGDPENGMPACAADLGTKDLDMLADYVQALR